MKKVLKIVGWAGLAGWFILVMGFVSERSEEVLCTRIDVQLDDTLQMRFVTPSDIRRVVEASDMDLQGYPLWEIDIHRLESLVEENAFVRNAEVSKDVSGRVVIRVEQRIPQVRIMPEGQRGYYLDEEGKALPLSDYFAPQIILATGYLPASQEEAGHSRELARVHDFCRFLAADEFWSKQIVQVYANKKGEYELIPRVGAHQILLGDLSQWEKKLDNLVLLYEQGLSRFGWNTYKTINLKYTNQVICTKR